MQSEDEIILDLVRVGFGKLTCSIYNFSSLLLGEPFKGQVDVYEVGRCRLPRKNWWHNSPELSLFLDERLANFASCLHLKLPYHLSEVIWIIKYHVLSDKLIQDVLVENGSLWEEQRV